MFLNISQLAEIPEVITLNLQLLEETQPVRMI